MKRAKSIVLKTFIHLIILWLLSISSLSALEKGQSFKIKNFEELERVIAQVQEKIQAAPKDVPLRVELAQLLMMEGKFEEAEKSLQKALELDSNNVQSLVVLSKLYRLEYKFEKFESTLEKIKALASQNTEARLLEARYAIDKMDFDKAQSIYRDIFQRIPDYAEAFCGIAEILYWENTYEEAEKFIEKCLTADPEFSRAYLLKSWIHRIRQENDQWKEAGQEAVRLAPFDDEARANLSNILMRGERKMEEGYEQAKIALRINPFSHTTHAYLGNGWTPKNYQEEKIEGDEATVKQIQNLLKEGDANLLNREFAKADLAFSQVLELSPSNIKAMIGKGTLNYHQEKYEEALSWFFKVLDKDFDYGLAHYGVSQSLLRKKDKMNIRLTEVEKKFATMDAPEPPFLRDVFTNYAQLDPDLQKIIRLSVKPLRHYLKLLKEKGATFHITPFHKLLWESPFLAGMKGGRTFDLRLWDDVKGCGGKHSTSGADWEKDVKYLRFNVVAHEFAHQVHGYLPPEKRKEIKDLFLKAKKERKTLDFYADFNEFEYFAVGVEAYVSEEKLPDQKIAYGHTRQELLRKDPDLYHFIERLDQQENLQELSWQKEIFCF